MTSILGDMSPATFLRDHWQKRPLLVRQAIPGFRGIISPDAFLKLATRGDARSRLVIQHPRRRGRGRWERHDGPFGGLDRGMLPASHWTLLVNGLESLVQGGWEILNAFAFIPAARIDDLMVSYATNGGSVGPHDDLYDVFLLQGPGRRRWQVSTQADRSLDPDAAIEVLKDFVPEEEWLLEPGDMLYLPPGVAHFGVAEGACFTYSIGFLAPTRAELVESFLGYLGAARATEVDPDARYEDPDLKLQREPLDVSDAMVERVAAAIGEVAWDAADVGDFLGRFLTRPRPRALFGRPARPMTMTELARRLRARRGQLSLALATRGLLRQGWLYVNGEAYAPRRQALALLRRLFRQRTLPLPVAADERTLGFLHEWYAAGYLEVR
ncbi:MAG TPA: cupin domain-containing protein [Polyangia bacterium]|jgi:50S ribosomal protein L16 3-hydroxylase